MTHVEVIPGIGLREVPVGFLKLPLAHLAAGVIARRGGREHAVHREKAGLHVVPVEIASEAHLFDLELAGAEHLGRAVDRMVDWPIEALQVVDVQADFRREELRVEYRRLLARVAVQPADVAVVRKRRDGIDLGPRLGCQERFRYGRRRRRCGGHLARRFLGRRGQCRRLSCRQRFANVHDDVVPGRLARRNRDCGLGNLREPFGLRRDRPEPGRQVAERIHAVAARHRRANGAAVDSSGRDGRMRDGKLGGVGDDSHDGPGRLVGSSRRRTQSGDEAGRCNGQQGLVQISIDVH